MEALNDKSGKQNTANYDKILSRSAYGGVPELADGRGLGPRAARRGGSSPPFPTIVDDGGKLGGFQFLFRRGYHGITKIKTDLVDIGIFRQTVFVIQDVELP